MARGRKRKQVRPTSSDGLLNRQLLKFEYDLTKLLGIFSSAEVASWVQDEKGGFSKRCSGATPITPRYHNRFYAFLKPVFDNLKKGTPVSEIREEMNSRPTRKEALRIVDKQHNFSLVAAKHIPDADVRAFAKDLATLLKHFKKTELAFFMDIDKGGFCGRITGKVPITLEFIELFQEHFRGALRLIESKWSSDNIREQLDNAYMQRVAKKEKAQERKREAAEIIKMKETFISLQQENELLKAILQKHGLDVENELSSISTDERRPTDPGGQPNSAATGVDPNLRKSKGFLSRC